MMYPASKPGAVQQCKKKYSGYLFGVVSDVNILNYLPAILNPGPLDRRGLIKEVRKYSTVQ